MTKNRHKKLRTITVEGKEYKWLTNYVNGGLYVKVWENKNTILYEGTILGNSITPGDVAHVISEINWEKSQTN